jgi:hypothetical protein
MSVEETVVRKLRELPLERQREVLDFVEFLGGKSQRAAALARMLSASEGATVSEDYVAELRRMRLQSKAYMLTNSSAYESLSSTPGTSTRWCMSFMGWRRRKLPSLKRRC